MQWVFQTPTGSNLNGKYFFPGVSSAWQGSSLYHFYCMFWLGIKLTTYQPVKKDLLSCDHTNFAFPKTTFKLSNVHTSGVQFMCFGNQTKPLLFASACSDQINVWDFSLKGMTFNSFFLCLVCWAFNANCWDI